MKIVRLLVVLALVMPVAAGASEAGLKLDRMPSDVNPTDPVSLQRGAQVYVNYCLGCHGLSYMRYNRLADIGLNEQQIRDNLIFTGVKVGDLIKTAMDAKEAKSWYGVTPPDLSVIARSRSSSAGSGADWLYTYLRGFYRDPSRPSGWNNTVFHNVGMPHILYALQGEQVLKTEVTAIPHGNKGDVIRHEQQKLVLVKPGTLKPAEYDRLVADLVNFLSYVGEPSRHFRVELGMYVLLFLFALFGLTYALKKAFWKDVH